MICLAAIVPLGPRVGAVLGIALCVCHNLLDPIDHAELGRWSWLWKIVHSGGRIQITPEHMFVVAYPLVPQGWFVVALGLVEGTAFAFASPALYLLVARASPPGRSSTAQGLFGAAGTVGTIAASLLAGILASVDLRYPFFATGIGIAVSVILGLALGRRALWDAMQPRHPGPLLRPVIAPVPERAEP